MNRWVAASLLFLANALWGTSYVVAKVALEELPPPLLGAIRFSIASLLLWLIIFVQRFMGGPSEEHAGPLETGDAWKLVGLGVVGISFNHLVTNFGQSMTTATDASLMIVGEVFFTTLLGALILKERPGRWKQVGVVVGGTGVALLILGGAQGGGPGSAGMTRALGDLLILLGLPGEALYSILGTYFVRRYSRLRVTAMINTGSLVIWVPILIWYLVTDQFPWGAWTALGGALYLAVVNSVICFLLWFTVLGRAGSNIGAISLFAQPLVGSVLGLTLMGDHVTPGLIAGGFLVLLALFFSTLPDRRRVHRPGQISA